MHADLSGVDPLVANLTHRVSLGDLPTRGAQVHGGVTALVDGDTEITYRQLEDLANSMARGLADHGLTRGDALALQVSNRWEFLVAFFACAKLGVVVLPVNLALSPADVAYQLADSGAVALITEEPFLADASSAIEASGSRALRQVFVVGTAPDHVAGREAGTFEQLLAHDSRPVEVLVEDRDILYCLYTSGTTSLPKGVVTSHVAVQIGVLSSALHLGLRPGTGPVMPIALPLFHVTALATLALPTLAVGGTVILHRGFDPGQVLTDFATRRVTHLTLLPAMWAALLDHPQLSVVDTSSLTLGLYAMAPMPADRLLAIRAAFPQASILLGSGQTETTPASEMQWPVHQGHKDDSWGPAVLTTDVRIMGPTGRLLPAGEEGEIVYRTPQLMEGYWHNPEANTAAFADGWFHGGDVGYCDDQGVVWFTDRTKDIIKTGGENVSSVEVERILLAHPSVGEAAVVGVPDYRWGEAVTAFVVAAPGLAPEPTELRAWCKERLAGFKVPKGYIVVDALPKTATGKIKKHEVRGAAAGG